MEIKEAISDPIDSMVKYEQRQRQKIKKGIVTN
jgi:hypothetical protein